MRWDGRGHSTKSFVTNILVIIGRFSDSFGLCYNALLALLESEQPFKSRVSLADEPTEESPAPKEPFFDALSGKEKETPHCQLSWVAMKTSQGGHSLGLHLPCLWRCCKLQRPTLRELLLSLNWQIYNEATPQSWLKSLVKWRRVD